MKFFRGLGKAVKPMVNFPAWMGWQQISVAGKTIKDTTKTILEKPKAEREESFSQAVSRLRLSEADLKQRMQMFLRMTIVYCGISLGLFFYAIYLVFSGHYAAALLSLILTVLAGALALRQNFWYFQMKQQRLGCTLKEWFNATFRGVK